MGKIYVNDSTFLDFNTDNAAAAICDDILSLVLETSAFGIYTMLVMITFLVILRSRKELVTRKTVLLVVCAVMYGAAASHTGLNLALLFITKDQLERALCIGMMQCTPCAEDDPACPVWQLVNPYLIAHPMALDMLPTALLAVNMALGDLVVLWRALVLWQGKRAVQVVSAILIAGTLGMLGWTVVGDRGLQDYSGSIAMLTSWLTNLWGTALVTVRAWQHRRRVSALLRAGSRTRAEIALLIFIESGALYCILWVPLIISSFIGSFTAIRDLPDRMGQLENEVSDIQSGLLIHIVGIYPTAVILLLKLSDHYAQRTLSLNDVPTLLPQHKMPMHPQINSQANTPSMSSVPGNEYIGRTVRVSLLPMSSENQIA